MRSISDVRAELDDLYSKDVHRANSILKEVDELLGELAKLRCVLASFTEPRPISELHEDDGFVLAARYDRDTIDYLDVAHLMDDGFEDMMYTHFYKLPNIQPPKDKP